MNNATTTKIESAAKPIVRAIYLAENGTTAEVRADAHRWIDAHPELQIKWSGDVLGTGF